MADLLACQRYGAAKARQPSQHLRRCASTGLTLMPQPHDLFSHVQAGVPVRLPADVVNCPQRPVGLFPF